MRFEKYYIGNTSDHKGLFSQLRGKEAAPNRVPDGNINMINETSTNNGITKKASSDYVFESPAITVSVNYAQTVFLQEEDFCASVNILILKSDWLTKMPKAGLYVVASLIKNNQKYDYSCKISKDRLNDTYVTLPTLDELDENSPYSEEGFIPDFDYMKEYIEELEQKRIEELEKERIEELERYLVATGFNDYELTDEDIDILSKTVRSETFKIVDVFTIKNSKNILKSDINFYKPKHPYVTAQEGNNSIMGYADYDENKLDKGNCIFIGGKTLVISYQKDDFFSNDSHNLLLYTKEIVSEQVYEYLITSLYKALKPLYSWNGSISSKKIQTDIFTLPIQTDAEGNPIIDTDQKYHPDGYIPDWDYMEQYITAIEKTVIKDVVDYKDEVIKRTRYAVKSDCESN